MWGYKPEATSPDDLVLYAIRGNINQKAPVDGAVELQTSAMTNLEE
jgi:SecD/SecF fusion protein